MASKVAVLVVVVAVAVVMEVVVVMMIPTTMSLCALHSNIIVSRAVHSLAYSAAASHPKKLLSGVLLNIVPLSEVAQCRSNCSAP